MVDDYKIDEFYSALEVSEIKGLTKQAIIDACKKGRFAGAVKSQPDKSNKQGVWLIPKQIIDNPDTNFVPAPIKQQIDLATLKADFTDIIAQKVAPLTQKLDEQTEIIKQLQAANENSTQTILTKIGETNKVVGELSRSARHSESSDLSWWRIVLVTIFVIGIIFAFSVIFTKYLQ